jgi:hypothetical protein
MPLIATMSRQEQQTMRLVPGEQVNVHVDKEAVHILADR